MRLKNAINWIVLLLLLIFVYIGFTKFQVITDWIALRNYQPPARIASLAKETTMKPDTKRIFYVNHPALDDKSNFNSHCKTTEQSIVLGCFVEHKGIYLLDVKDERLSGVVEVTAAHETLHAIYARLSSNERKKVDKMTARFFAQQKNPRIKETVENYRQKDPNIVPNELHSILGTEVRNLSPELERYYAKYFQDREQIVNFSEKYEQTFIDLRNQVGDIDGQLNLIKAQIDNNQKLLNSKSRELDQMRKNLNSLLSQNNVEAYNAGVSDFNASVGTYNSLINSTKQLISQYNSLVEKRNAIATEERELVQAIDSNSVKEVKKQ